MILCALHTEREFPREGKKPQEMAEKVFFLSFPHPPIWHTLLRWGKHFFLLTLKKINKTTLLLNQPWFWILSRWKTNNNIPHWLLSLICSGRHFLTLRKALHSDTTGESYTHSLWPEKESTVYLIATLKKQLSDIIRSRIEVRTMPNRPKPIPVLSSHIFKKHGYL